MPPKKSKNPIPKVQINALYAKYINNSNQQDTNSSIFNKIKYLL
jgi:hypothetical protein